MADLTRQVRAALGRYWSEIYGGAAAGLTTQDLFVNIRARASELGLPSVGVGANAISTLRGYAGRMLAAADALLRAPDAAAITSQYIAQTPWSRSMADQATMSVFNISFEHTIQLDDGSIVSKMQTIVVTGQLPGTVGELRGMVTSEAALMAAEGGAIDSGTPHGISLGVDNIAITAV